MEEVQREVTAQAREGYDLIKFHEVYTREAGNVTTTGLSLAAYLRMNEVAREIGIPLVGHAPVNLGLEAVLQARQPLAHIGMLSSIYFLPVASNRMWLATTASTLAVLVLIVTMGSAAAIARRLRGLPRPSRRISRVQVLVGLELAAGVVAPANAALFLHGGPIELIFTHPMLEALLL